MLLWSRLYKMSLVDCRLMVAVDLSFWKVTGLAGSHHVHSTLRPSGDKLEVAISWIANPTQQTQPRGHCLPSQRI